MYVCIRPIFANTFTIVIALIKFLLLCVFAGYFTQLNDHCNGWKTAIGYNSVYQSFTIYEKNSTGGTRPANK